MLGILVILIISWFLLHFLERENFMVLGPLPVKKRFTQAIAGFALTKSIFLPLGIHLGWNFVATLFTKISPYGELVCIQVSSSGLPETNNFTFALIKGLGAPLIILIYVWFFYLNKLSGINDG